MCIRFNYGLRKLFLPCHVIFEALLVFVFAGIAINKDGVIYFADGVNIRTVDSDGNIRTVIGSQGHPRYFEPLPCYKVISASDVRQS